MKSTSEGLAGDAAQTASAPSELRRRITYLMLFRLVLISLVLGSTILLAWLSDVDLGAANAVILFGIIAATYVLTIVYALLLDRVSDDLRFAYVQIGLDLVITTLLIHITGGAQSAYTFFFPVAIIGAATVRYRLGAVVATLLSIALYSAVSLLGWYELLPIPHGQRVLPFDLSVLELARAMGLNVAAFSAVGMLAVNLGGQLHQTSASLASEREAAADLVALHEDIVRGLTSGLITIDARNLVLNVNHAARDILHVHDVAPGGPLEDFAPELATALEEASDGDAMRRGEVEVTLADGERRVLGLSVSPLVDHLERTRGRIINFQDLTELRQMETQYKRAERLATIGTVAAGVAHELRNPLASISGSIELLRSTDGEDQAALMGIIEREVGRLDGLIAELLDYTNPRPRQNVRFDLVALTRETLRVFSRDPTFAGVHVELRAPEAPIELRADPSKLRQVLWNLLRNAAQAVADDAGTVTVELARTENQALMDVIDDGPGITTAARDRIFDPFFTTRTRGTGLGLAIVQSLVAEHGGQVDVETESGVGTTFSVRIPLGEPV